MERRIFVIWNPFAGGKVEKLAEKLRNRLDQERISHSFFDTRETKSAAKTIHNHLDESFSDLIIIGGDGTINESINGLSRNIPVGIVPAGTGDDFVKNIPIGKSSDERIQTAIHGQVVAIDLGQCNDRKFVNGVGIGFDGQIVEDMQVKRVPLLSGHAAYYYHVLRIIGSYREKKFRYTVDGKSLDKPLILLTIGNGTTFGGGFKLMPEAKINDGFLQVCEIGKISPLRRFLNINRLSGGTHGKLSEVSFHKATKVMVEANDQLYAHIDGERLGQPPFEISVLQGALSLRVASDL